ncbi:hypothetical protein DFH94DRAFT_117972 [Russula ochroleuca]|uniref:ubiquitinyl hydrolase 1 n=1 Tax=Russula ochroleuca TaxID=152965 RepID=A0A9P5K1E3_9AGAM|nr:hypothetical protein DFH94DRAFT_117972 [Russula ochroleuca]
MTSVHSGTILSKKQRSKGLTAFLSVFSERFAIFTSLYIKSTSSGSTVSPQVKKPSIIAGHPSLSYPTKPYEIGDSSQPPAATSPALPVHTSPHPTDTSPPAAVAAALQDISPAATLPYPLEGTTKRDIVAPCTEPDVTEILSAASLPAPTPAPTLVPVPASTPPVLIESWKSRDPGSAATFNPLLPASPIVGFSIPSSPPPSRVPPLPNAESLSPLSSTTPSHSTGNTALPRLRTRGLVNAGSMCIANAVLQLLVHSPPFWDLFRELGDLKGPRGAGVSETSDGATPLVDATLRFFEEFMFKGEPPPAQQPPQQIAGRIRREDEDARKEHDAVDSFEPTYIYDAMKGKRQLEAFLDGQQQDAEEFFHLYLDALDEELLALPASISGHKLASTAPGVGREEEREVSQSGQTNMGKRGFMAESVESRLKRIFGGKFRSIVRAPNMPDTVNIEDWRSLQLDIQHDSVHAIEGALARISHLQPVQLGPSCFSEASQQVLIEALPSVLVIHLKRFLSDVAADGVVKISKPVRFAPGLEIPLEILAPVAGKSAEPVNYKLYGVLYHHGKSTGGGNYTVDVLHRNGESGNGEGWLRIDDEVVSAVRHEDVFGSGDNERVDERCAYMLSYCRTDPTQT